MEQPEHRSTRARVTPGVSRRGDCGFYTPAALGSPGAPRAESSFLMRPHANIPSEVNGDVSYRKTSYLRMLLGMPS